MENGDSYLIKLISSYEGAIFKDSKLFEYGIALGKFFFLEETKRIGIADRGYNTIVGCDADPCRLCKVSLSVDLIAVRSAALHEHNLADLLFMVSVHFHGVGSLSIGHGLFAECNVGGALKFSALNAHSCTMHELADVGGELSAACITVN